MNKILVIFNILYFCCCCVSCSTTADNSSSIDSGQQGGGAAHYYHWFVDRYAELTEIVPKEKGYCYLPDETLYFIRFDFTARALSLEADNSFKQITGEDNKKNKFFHYEKPISALAHWFSKIQITSDADYNGIPAGQSLNTKFEIMAESAWPIIQTGTSSVPSADDWKDTFISKWYLKRTGSGSYVSLFTPVQGLLSNLGDEDLYLLNLDTSLFLIVREIPEIKDHVFTITIYEGDVSWKASVPVSFQ